jgi:hypothetical protein
VFYGDNRPSMMARSTTQSTLLAPPGQQGPPEGEVGARPMSYAPGGGNRPISMAVNDPRPKSYAPGVPTLNFPDEDAEDGDLGTANRARNTRSVFGPDMVWEREMAKLKELQAAQARANEEVEARERAKEEAKQAKVDARESKMYHAAQRKSFFGGVGSGNSRKSMLNPDFVPENDPNFVRPMSIAFGPGGIIIPTGNEDTGDESDDEGDGSRNETSPRTSRDRPTTTYSERPQSTFSDRPPTLVLDTNGSELTGIIPQPPGPPPPRRPGSRLGVETWFADSDEEEDAPLSRRKSRPAPAPIQPPEMSGYDSDSEEDVPLSRLKVVDSDEEVPLSRLRKGPAVGTPTTATSGTVRPKSGAPSLPGLGDGLLDFDLTPTSPLSPTPRSGANSPPVGASAGLSGDEEEDEDDVPLFVRKARQRASQPKTKEEIEDDLPLGWKHAGGGGSNRATQTQSFARPSFYGQPAPYSPYGMPGMGMMGGMGGMMPPMSPMGPPMNPMGMGGMPMGGMGMPPMGYGQPGMEMPDPGSNIDRWRQNVSGRAGSVAGSAAPSHVGR